MRGSRLPMPLRIARCQGEGRKLALRTVAAPHPCPLPVRTGEEPQLLYRNGGRPSRASANSDLCRACRNQPCLAPSSSRVPPAASAPALRATSGARAGRWPAPIWTARRRPAWQPRSAASPCNATSARKPTSSGWWRWCARVSAASMRSSRNAGLAKFAPLAETTLEMWNQVLATNLTSTFLLAKAAAGDLKQAHGAIVTIASTRAHMSEPGTLAYSASKGGVVALTHALAMTLAPKVRVNCVSPGWIDTGKHGPLKPSDHAQHPAGRVGRRGGHRRGGGLPAVGRGGVHHRRRAGGRRRHDAQDDLYVGGHPRPAEGWPEWPARVRSFLWKHFASIERESHSTSMEQSRIHASAATYRSRPGGSVRSDPALG